MPTIEHAAQLVKISSAAEIEQTTYNLLADVCTLGRSETCQVIVRRNDISRLHARIERDEHRYILSDADSANGTYINGQRIHRAQQLRHGDRIGLGGPTPLLSFVDPDPTFERRSRLRYDNHQLAFFLDDQKVPLTPTEQRLLMHVFQHEGVVCHHEGIADAVWGEDRLPGVDSRLDGVIRDIRKKLNAITPTSGQLIVNHHGKGYELIE